MRDGHRLREKIELTIDDRQVAALAVGALLLLAGMFALGLLVGMQLARRAPQPILAGDLAALDAQRAQAQNAAAPAALHAPPPLPRQREERPEQQVAAVRPEAPARKEMPAPPATVSVAPARTSAIEAERPVAVPEPPGEVGRFTVQLGATQDEGEAAQLAARARSVGLQAYVAEARLPAKGVWYRVRVGAFADKETAERFRRDVDRELRTAAVVMPSR